MDAKRKKPYVKPKSKHTGVKFLAESFGGSVLSALTFVGLDLAVGMFSGKEEEVGFVSTSGIIVGLVGLGFMYFYHKKNVKNLNHLSQNVDKITSQLA